MARCLLATGPVAYSMKTNKNSKPDISSCWRPVQATKESHSLAYPFWFPPFCGAQRPGCSTLDLLEHYHGSMDLVSCYEKNMEELRTWKGLQLRMLEFRIFCSVERWQTGGPWPSERRGYKYPVHAAGWCWCWKWAELFDST